MFLLCWLSFSCVSATKSWHIGLNYDVMFDRYSTCYADLVQNVTVLKMVV